MEIHKEVKTTYLMELSDHDYQLLVSYLKHCLKDRKNFDIKIDYIVSEMIKNM